MMRKNILGKNEDVKMRLLKTSILMSAPLSLSFFAQSLNMKMTKSVFSILRWWWFALLCFFISSTFSPVLVSEADHYLFKSDLEWMNLDQYSFLCGWRSIWLIKSTAGVSAPGGEWAPSDSSPRTRAASLVHRHHHHLGHHHHHHRGYESRVL